MLPLQWKTQRVSKWTRHGECNHCGWCCEKVARDCIVRTDEQVQRDPAFYAARGFKPTRVDGAIRFVLWAWLEAPCPQKQELSYSDGLGGFGKQSRCGIYLTRPETCQTFPRLPVDIVGTPCSYWFEAESVKGRVSIGGSASPHPGSEAALLALEQALVS